MEKEKKEQDELDIPLPDINQKNRLDDVRDKTNFDEIKFEEYLS